VKLDPNIRAFLDEERFTAVDDAWLAHLEEFPTDLGYFLPVVSALLQRQQQPRAETLVQLWLDNQRSAASDGHEIRTLGELLTAWPEAPFLRHATVEALRRHHADCPSLDRLLEHFRLPTAVTPRQALDQVLAWIQFDVGKIVDMPKRGCGRVVELNLALGTLRVEFPPQREIVSFRLAEAQTLLRVLEPEHFLVQKLEHLPALQELAGSDPGALLDRVFTSCGSPLPAATLREHLRDVVPEEHWTGWWKRAREDARLTVSGGPRSTCNWSASASAAEDRLTADFAAAAPAQRLELARKHAARSPALGRALATGLVQTLATNPELEPGLVLEFLLELEQLPDVEPKPKTTIANWLRRDDALAVVAAMRDRRARERAFEALRQERPDWAEIYVQALDTESDVRLLTQLYEAVRDSAASSSLVRAVTETLQRPGRSPRFYLWVCREMSRRAELALRADWRFLRGLLDACTSPDFRGQRAVLRQFFAANGLADTVIATLDTEQSTALLALLGHEVGLDEHTKQGLRDLVTTRFPALREAKEEALLVSEAALARKRAEFDQLVRVEIPRNTEELRTAAAHGDLRENFEYKSARERQEMLSARAQRMHDELRRARAIDPSSIDPGAVRVGTRVHLTAGTAAPVVLTILGPWDSDPARGIVSYLAPAVTSLLGKRVGEDVRFGEATYRVTEIAAWQADESGG